MTRDENKLEILKKVENGTLSIEEGSDLIGILENADKSEKRPEILDPITPLEPMEPSEKPKTPGCWKAAWSMILAGGAVLAGFAAWWVYQGYQKSGFGWGFWLSWIPFAIGILIMIAGWILMESPWLNVRVHSKDEGKKVHIVFSMPIPIKFASWVMRKFGHLMPEEVRDKGLGDIFDAWETSVKNGESFLVHVDDEKDGYHVEVSIG
jgi:hypothetical protein